MPELDLIVRGGHVVLPERVAVLDIGIADGHIVALAAEIREKAASELSAAGQHVLAGVIDAHVHFNEPGRTDWEGWTTGSRALAAGGGTLCFDMPLNAHPPTINVAAFDAKLAAATGQSLTDFALWGGLIPGNVDELPALAARGVIGFKAFMSRSGTDDFPAADDLTLYEGMRQAAGLGRIVAVHAESDSMTGALAGRAVANGQIGIRDYLASRPVIAELEAISRAILLAEETGCALHIVHVSSGRGVALVVAARARGVDVSCETCAHYLCFTDQDVERLGAAAKCAPPLRDSAEREALWAAIAAGELPIVTSDHSPAPAALKTSENFFAVWGGIAGVQSTLPVLLTSGHHQRGLALTLLSRLVSAAVARRFDLPARGRIAPGHVADLCLVELDPEWALAATDLHDRHRLSAFVGSRFRGRVTRTLLGGETIYADGAFPGPPRGRLVRPAASAVAASWT